MTTHPRVRGLPYLGLALDFRRDPLAFIGDLWRRHGDLVEFEVAGQRMFFVNRPEYVQHILLKNHKNYDRRNMMYREMKILFRNATPVADGERWKRSHGLIQPTFSFKKVEEMSGAIVERITASVRSWEERAQNAREPVAVDFGADLHRLTLDIIVRTMFGGAIDGKEAEVATWFRTILDTVVARILSPVNLPLWVPTPRSLKYRDAIRKLDRLIHGIIERKSRERDSGAQAQVAGEFQDMLTMWMEAGAKARGGAFIADEIRDEVVGIFVAAHGSTAMFLSWTFYHLATHPEIQDRVRAEVDQVLGGRVPSYGDLPGLSYTRQVIEESMRITPPGWIFSRSTIEEDRLGDTVIPPRSMMLISPYYMHRRADLWSDPERFDPERFSESNDERIKGVSREFGYIPFSGGPRVCTGKNLAMVECLLIVSMAMQKLKFSLKPGHRIEAKGGFTLTLDGGLLLKIEGRG
jgi:cytochrome P450